MITERFPDLYRYRKTELGKQKLIAGSTLLTLLCLVIYQYHDCDGPVACAALAKTFFFIQAIAWVIIAPAQSGSAVSGERIDRTWDFQRLTPLTSFQTTVGKLFGVPAFSYLMGLLVLPWGAVAAIHADGEHLSTWLFWQLTLVGMTLLANGVGLLVSATDSIIPSRASVVSGPFLGMVLLIAFNGAVGSSALREGLTAPFYSWQIPPDYFFTLTVYAFAVWAILGSKWQIGADYLEPRRFWRLPVFLIFLVVYEKGVMPSDTFGKSGIFLLAFVVYGLALIQPHDDHFSARDWVERIRTKVPHALNAVPLWISGWATLLVLAMVTSVGYGPLTFMPILFFLLRDLALQDCARFLKFKQARIFMLALSLSLYFVPLLFFKSSPDFAAWFAPVLQFGPEMAGLALVNVCSALVHAVLAVALLVFLEKRSARA